MNSKLFKGVVNALSGVIVLVYADFHLHSKYSRATSKEMWPDALEKYAKMKGLNLLGTGDITHPKYLQVLKESLHEDGTGILRTKEGFTYVLQGEISLVYTQDGRSHRVHHLLLAPDFATVDAINDWLDTKGRRDYDGRPIFGFSSIELAERMHQINPRIMVIPAHAWTPWFSVFGSNSGFNSLQECFKDQTKRVHAIETGLSSDPAMNWRVSSLDSVALLSNSDSHSPWPWRMGRECNVFAFDDVFTYANITDAIKNRDKRHFLYTIEVDPAYGKYHWDGHRMCGVVLSPEESAKSNGVCPKCKQRLTIGVESRVNELADRPVGFVPENAIPFKTLLPLAEIISFVMKIKNPYAVHVRQEYEKLVKHFGNEFNVMLETAESELATVTTAKIAEYIMKNRKAQIRTKPGYDGVYGEPIIDGDDGSYVRAPVKTQTGQKTLGEF